jgi:hypothetical protein
MLLKSEEKLNKIRDFLLDKNFQKKIFIRIKSKEYIVHAILKIEKMIENHQSINILINHNLIEDSYTILRKFLETYFFISVNLVNPSIIPTYLEHEKMLTLKVVGASLDDVKKYTYGKPDGFLEYGFVQDLVQMNSPGFKFTIKSVAEAGGQIQYYRWYKVCSNFVHNNLNQVAMDKESLKNKIIVMINQLVNNLYDLFFV